MSTPTSTPTFIGLPVHAVAKATGLSRGEIYRIAAIADLGAPRHMAYPNAVMVYTPEGLAVLAETLRTCDMPTEADALIAILAKHQPVATSASVVAVLPRPAGRLAQTPLPTKHWLDELEARQEGESS